MNAVVGPQANLPLRAAIRQIPETDFAKLTSEAAAIKFICENSGLQDKALAYELDTDAGTLSRAKQGAARLSDDAIQKLQDVTGIEAVLVAALLRRGYDPRSLRKLESETERELRIANETIDKLLRDREVEVRLMRELRA